ncbi:MAG TPA: sigma factor [Polyangiaceae bacterium]
MPDIAPPTNRFAAVQALLDDVNWIAFRFTLANYAFGRCHDRKMADDLAQEAIRRLWEPTSAWDPSVEPDLLAYAMGTVNSILWGERTRAEAKNVPLDTSGADGAFEPADPRGMTEERLADVDLAARRLNLLRTRLAHDPEAMQIVELTLEGLDTPFDQRTRMGLSEAEILAARKRVQRAAAAVARDVPDEDPPSRPGSEESGEDDEKEVA